MTDVQRTSAPVRFADRRYFEDPDGVLWEVREMANSEQNVPTGPSLIFESAGAVRRVRDYPPGWFDLSPADLRDLSSQR